MAFFNSKRAWFFNEKGEYHGLKGFSKNDKLIKYSQGAYNVDFENMTYKENSVIPILWKRRIYFYNLSNSNPIKLDKKAEPLISPELYNINLETKVARDLNDLSKKGLLDFLTPTTIIIMLAVGGLVYYLLTGGKFGT